MEERSAIFSTYHADSPPDSPPYFDLVRTQMLELRPVSLQSKGLLHPDGKSDHHPHKARTVMAASQRKKDSKGLKHYQVGDVEEIRRSQGMFKAKPKLEIKLSFRGAKIVHHLCI